MNLHAFQSRLGFAGLLLLAGLVLWIVAAWPLPQVFSQAIPHTNVNVESQTVSPIAPGDHLQLLYHFWLGLDAFSGHSPLFFNVYEFNLGDDRARLQPNLYYMPFSLIYAALAPWAGHAAGWNAAGLASVLLGVLFTGLLARRFTRYPAAALLATLVAAAFPYRWIVLFTGSPTGFAMAFPPLLFYGLDRAIRDRSAMGGAWAGIALFCAYTTDAHVFYFSALAVPFMALFSFWMSTPAPVSRPWPAKIRAILIPLLPFALLAAAAGFASMRMSRHLLGSVMASGRTLAEMASYSPPAVGLVSTVNAGMSNHVYFGVPLFALLAAALAFWIHSTIRRDPVARPPAAQRLAVWALIAALAAIVMLALGIHGPFEGLPIRLARKPVPQYAMIRQTVKIYCLVPALLAVLLALLFDGMRRFRRNRDVQLASTAVIGLLVLWTIQQALSQTSPGLCRLPRENAAYAAVAGDVVANAGQPASALAIPLWPGDSHWSSLYEYAVMLSRVRLVNGYTPSVPTGYSENVFNKYESLNQGFATDEQLDGLLGRGVRHLILHANAFPEAVSPFPAAATLRALVGHPRLALIADDGQTFAFRILPKHPIDHVPHANWTDALYAAARQWNWSPALKMANAQMEPLLLRMPVSPAPGLRYLLRLGEGSAQPLLVPPGESGIASLTQPIPGLPDWLQAELPCPTGALVNALSGPVVIQRALLTAGELPAPGPDGSIHVAPALLFHAGHSTPGQDHVTFDPETVPARQVLYGPQLPFPPGVYDVTLTYALSAGGAQIHSPGFFRVLALPDLAPLAEAELDPAAETLVLRAVTLGAEPIRFEFHYTAQAPLVLRDIRLVPATIKLVPAT
jgi:hypothetical protein